MTHVSAVSASSSSGIMIGSPATTSSRKEEFRKLCESERGMTLLRTAVLSLMRQSAAQFDFTVHPTTLRRMTEHLRATLGDRGWHVEMPAGSEPEMVWITGCYASPPDRQAEPQDRDARIRICLSSHPRNSSFAEINKLDVDFSFRALCDAFSAPPSRRSQ